MPDIPSLIANLTLEEKLALIAGRDYWTTNGIPRLNIPPMKMTDGPNGARGEFVKDGTPSACFPAGVSLGATWDRDLMFRVGKALGEETKTKGAQVLLGPTVCIHRDPRGGRNFESFAEDPVLTGELASQYISGVQSQGISATIKHFVANEQESLRFTIDEDISERALREIYLKSFEIAIKKAEPWALMTSYNKVNGIHTDMSEFLLANVLRKEWGFQGLVMSDWGGMNSTVESLNAGNDLEMPGPSIRRPLELVQEALDDGQLSIETIDDRVEKYLEFMNKVDQLTNPKPFEETAIDRPEHRQLIRQAGADGAVLLKNEGSLLPLKPHELKSVALIGLAKECLAFGGGCAAINTSHHRITPFEALTETLGDSVDIKYCPGAHIEKGLPYLADGVVNDNGKPGFTATLHHSYDRTGEPEIKELSKCSFNPLVDNLSAKALTLSGTFTPRESGNHYFSLATVGNTRVYINDEVVFDCRGSSARIQEVIWDVASGEIKQFEFTAGQQYRIRVEAQGISDAHGAPSIFSQDLIALSLGFMYQSDMESDLLTPAISAAEASDVAIVFVGNPPEWESEGVDRLNMDLPRDGSLDRLVSSVAAANKKTIVVNSSGSPVTMPWISEVPSVLQVFFPGQEAGYSIADILLGNVNPSGKLPVTFPISLSRAPSYENFPGDLDNGVVKYQEDVFVGYRHYDLKPEGVLFPFGFGLSYTSFSVSCPAISSEVVSQDTSLSVTVRVENTGEIAGSEVIQVYVGAPSSSAIDRPKKVLAGFSKVHLLPGCSSDTTIDIGLGPFCYWDDQGKKWHAEAGNYGIHVGTSSTKIGVTRQVTILESFSYGA